ncbi:hypothetical protein J3A83DRAFT_165166 [Scleroderma citrinum]
MTVFNIISVPFRRMIFCGLFPPLFTLLFIDLGKFFFFFAVVPSWLAGLPPPHAHCMMCLASISGVSSHVHRSSSRPPPLAVFFMCLFLVLLSCTQKCLYIIHARGEGPHEIAVQRIMCAASSSTRLIPFLVYPHPIPPYPAHPTASRYLTPHPTLGL